MTTIAYRFGTLAADSLISTSTHRDGYCTKIIKNGPYLFAATGLWSLALGFLDWARAGLPPGCQPPMVIPGHDDDDAQGFIFCPDGEILIFGRRGISRKRLIPEASYYAMGSGADYCYGAMAMGATAPQAVEAALIHETCSGGPIIVLRH